MPKYIYEPALPRPRRALAGLEVVSNATCPNTPEDMFRKTNREAPYIVTMLITDTLNKSDYKAHAQCESCSSDQQEDMIMIQSEHEQDLTRLAIQAKGPEGKWTRKPLAYRESNNVHLLITRPPEICVNLVFKHIHAASSYTICRQFVPFIYCPL